MEVKPLLDYSSVGPEKVTSMDIHEESGLLISGYRDGSIVLWDLMDYKLLKFIPGLHQSDVTNIKFNVVNANSTFISAVSCEDKGAVRWIEISKRAIFGGYNF